MKSLAITTERAAIYLLKAPAKFVVQVNKELLVVFTAPELMIAGAALCPAASTLREITPLLTTLLEKFRTDFKTKPEQIRVKLFGMSEPQKPVLAGVMKWLDGKNLKVSSSDTGRQVARNLVVECETGLVGVSYAEGITPSIGDWLAPGTSSARAPSTSTENKILVLSCNRVLRQLCRQAVEEHLGWTADCPESPFDTLMTRTGETFPWRAVIIFEDLGKEKPVEKYLTKMKTQFPGVPISWVGITRPRFAKTLALMPLLKPQAPKKFKSQLAKMITLVIENGVAAEVIPFPTKRKK